jgi:hypothetical protein
MPQTLQSAWTRLERHTVPRTASNTSQYSESARGKSAARGWHLSSLLLRIPGWVPPGHVEGKEHTHVAALLEQSATLAGNRLLNSGCDAPSRTQQSIDHDLLSLSGALSNTPLKGCYPTLL